MTETKWTTQEKLVLASAVHKNGENNWASVSKCMRNWPNTTRSAEFFSQKNCAQQYTRLIENLAPPRRKRTENASSTGASAVQLDLSTGTPSPSQAIIEKLRQDRAEELRSIVEEENEMFRKIQRQVEMIRSGQIAEDQIALMLAQRLKAAGIQSASSIPPPVIEKPTSLDSSMDIFSNDQQIEQPPISEEPAVITPTTPSSVKSTPKHPGVEGAAGQESPTIIQSPRTPQVDLSRSITSPRTPIFNAYQPTMSPSKTPSSSLQMYRPSTPVTSPSASPLIAGQSSSLFSPTRSVTHSPAHPPIENTSVQEILQKMRSPSPIQASPTREATNALLKEMAETSPVVELEKLSSQVTSSLIEVEDQSDDDAEDEEEEPLSKLKTQAPQKSMDQSGEGTSTAAEGKKETMEQAKSPVVDRPEAPPAEVDPTKVSPEPMVPPLKILRSELHAKKDKEMESTTPKRVQPARGKSTGATSSTATTPTTPTAPAAAATPAAGQQAVRRKQNSGGSAASSETAPTPAPAPVAKTPSTRVPQHVPAPFPDQETYKQWKRMITNVWNMAAGHRHASLFLQPVKDSIAPGYSRLVKRPIDLSVIKKQIDNGTLTTTDDVRLQLMLMFTNAVMYNSSSSEVHQMSKEMALDVMKHLDEMLQPINDMFSGRRSSDTNTKSMRRTRQQHHPPNKLVTEVTTRRSHTKKQQVDDDSTEKTPAKRQK